MLVTGAAAIILGGCNGTPSVNVDDIDVISVTDNGKTYADTLYLEPGGEVVGVGRAVEGNALVKEATGGRRVQSVNAAMEGHGTQCAIRKKDGKSVLTLIHNAPSAGFPLTLSIANATGPVSGVGEYKGVAGSGAQLNTFGETGINGGPYTVDSVLVNVTRAEGTVMTGDFSMWVRGAAGSKVVTGSINCHTAAID